MGFAAPYATAAYFVVWLAAQASSEFVRPSDLLVPLAIAFAVAGAAHFGAWLWTRAADRASLIAVVVTIVFSSLGHILAALAGADALGMPGGPWIPVGLLAIAAGASVVAIASTHRRLNAVPRIVTSVAVGLCLLNLVGGAKLFEHRRPAEQLRPSGIVAPARRPGNQSPDIYLIIVDKYTGSRVLADQYGFDNSQFTDFLRTRGFAVPSASHSNYVQTFLSLGSMLNLEYVGWLADSLGIDNPRWADAYHLVENNRVASFLRERGYRFVFLPTAFGVTRENRYADAQLPDPKDIRPEFVTAWLSTTAVPLIRYVACELLGCLPSEGGYVPETAALFDWKFEALARLAQDPRPLFVLAHIGLPHEPYVYNGDCRHRQPFWPRTDTGEEAPRVRAAYLEQIRCLNRKLTVLVTNLQDHSSVPPVIMIQGDHGHGLLGRNLPALNEAEPWQIEDRTAAFAAYAVPGVSPSAFPDRVTPINAMRTLLRLVFGAELPPMEDATYWSSFDRPYRLRRVR